MRINCHKISKKVIFKNLRIYNLHINIKKESGKVISDSLVPFEKSSIFYYNTKWNLRNFKI